MANQHAKDLDSGMPRNINDEWLSTRQVVVISGVRRCGKSYLLRQIREKNTEKDYYFRFDDERLINFTVEDFETLDVCFSEFYGEQHTYYFDEIQNIQGWELYVRRLYNEGAKVYITGSNAKMLSREMGTHLSGIHIPVELYPFSFSEYLQLKNVTIRKTDFYTTTGAAMLSKHLKVYMLSGGFPELVNYRNKRHWLNDLYEKIILGDVILRNKIKNEMQLRMTIKRLAENIMQPTSYSRIANLIKAAGFNTTTASVSDYISFAKDACLIFSLDNYTSKFVEKNTVKKHYFTDNGLLSIFLSGGETALLENVCAIALYRKYGDKLYFYNKNVEVDFYIPEENYAVQVSYSIHDEETRRRETSALIKLNDFLPLNKLLIITFDEEESIPISDNKTIEVVPAWKWLIESERGC